MSLTVADVFVGAVAVAVVIWVLLYVGCAPPPLPAEPPYTETVTQRDR